MEEVKNKKGGFLKSLLKILSFGLIVAKAGADAGVIRGTGGAILKNINKEDLPKN